MQAKISLLLLVSLILFSNFLVGQTTFQDKIFYVDAQGQKIALEKIISSKTNEDRVTFIEKGNKKTVEAKDIKSYYKKGEKVSIKLEKSGRSKFVKIVVAGPIFLASSVKPNGKSGYYVKKDDKWYDLEPHRKDLRKYFDSLISDFGKGVKTKRIVYDLHSLGQNISTYNAYKNPIYTKRSIFPIRNSKRFGAIVSSGIGIINFKNELESETSASHFTVGLAANFDYTRLFGVNIQLAYSRTVWNTNPSFKFNLNRVQFTPMLQTLLYSNYKNFDLKLGTGLSVDFDANSVLDFPTRSLNPINLRLVSVGYHAQLTASFNKKWNVFVAFQLLPKVITQNISVTQASFLTFSYQHLKGGAMLLF